MPSAIYGVQKSEGSPSTSTYTKAQVLELETAIGKSLDFLTTKKTAAQIESSLSGASQIASNAVVFGFGDAKTVGERFQHVYKEKSIQDDLKKGATTANKNISGVFDKMMNNGYKTVKLTISNKEAYNLVSKRTILKVIDSVKVGTYSK